VVDKVYIYPSLGGAFSMNRYLEGVKKGLQMNGVAFKIIRPRGFGLISKYIIYPFQALKQRKLEGDHLIISERYAYLLLFLGNAKTTIVCHDLHTLYKEANTGKLNTIIYKFFLNALSRSNRIICVSSHTKKDLMNFIPNLANNHIKVVPNGIESFWSKPIDVDYKWPWGHFFIGKRVLLSVGTDVWYKNNEVSIKLLEKLPENYILLRIGGFKRKNLQLVEDLNLKERIVHLSNITDKDLKYAYYNSFVFLSPSISEGFGWPALEAALCNCPVVTFGSGAINEVLGESSIVAKSLTDMVEKILDIHGLNTKKVSGMNWENQVKLLLGN